jgi:putative ABC transport system permease protein
MLQKISQKILHSFQRTPLAWRQLMKEKARLLVAIAGIGFADMLIFVQLGFQDALYDSAIKPYTLIQADLLMISPQSESLSSLQSFDRQQLYQTLGYTGVESISSLYVKLAPWKNPTTRQTRSILVWGVEPGVPSFQMPEVKASTSQLQMLNTVLFDRASRPEYGVIAENITTQGLEAELNRKTVNAVGIFTLGTSFVADGNVITSDSTFLNLFPDHQASKIDIGLIQLQPGANLKAVQGQLQAGVAGVEVLSAAEFIARERNYWEVNSPISFIFGMGVIMGFVVGIVIVYQILYTDVVNHLPEYATLKAMGYTDNYLLVVLFQEALILAVFGYLPGFLVSLGIYQLAYGATLLPIAMKLERAVTVLVLTFLMCTASGAIAMRKLRSADPADNF